MRLCQAHPFFYTSDALSNFTTHKNFRRRNPDSQSMVCGNDSTQIKTSGGVTHGGKAVFWRDDAARCIVCAIAAHRGVQLSKGKVLPNGKLQPLPRL